jgi:hypothetical protein
MVAITKGRLSPQRGRGHDGPECEEIEEDDYLVECDNQQAKALN